LFVTIFFQIRWLNSGLRRFDALYIVPVFQSFWILVSVISGMVFFGEYEDIFGSIENSVMFPFGVLVTISGVYVLSQRAITDPDEQVTDASLTQPLIDGTKDTSDRPKVKHLPTSTYNHKDRDKEHRDKDGYCSCKPDQLCNCANVNSLNISVTSNGVADDHSKRSSHLYALGEQTAPLPVGKGSLNTIESNVKRIGAVSRILRRRTSQEVVTIGLLGRLSIIEDDLENTPQSPPIPEELSRGISLQRTFPLSDDSQESETEQTTEQDEQQTAISDVLLDDSLDLPEHG